ncbi:MAG: cation:proton antiporter [Actinomycetota bacterium]|nr:cation:proton antiporter [Actinomycetota bacterium]
MIPQVVGAVSTGLTGHQLTVMWAQVGLLLLFARMLGSLARKVGQSAVVGELAAGLVLGPSVLGRLFPSAASWFLPAHSAVQSGLLQGVATISLGFLLLAIGFETDLGLIGRLGTPAVWASVGSLAIPLAAGYAVATRLPAALYGGRPSGSGYLIVALAVGISSLPVIAKIVAEMGLTRRNVGQLTIAVGTVNDAVGFFVLAVLSSFVGHRGGPSLLSVLKPLAGLSALALAFLLGAQRLVDLLLRRIRKGDPEGATSDGSASLAACVVLGFLAAAATQALGIEGVLGTFVAGVALGRSRFRQAGTLARLEAMSSAVFAPLYFANAGLRVNASLLGRPPVLVALAVLVVTAVGSKLIGSLAGALRGGLKPREAVALGMGLNGRGALQVVIAGVGLATGLIGVSGYSVILVMAIVTSVLVPGPLRLLTRGWEGSDEEKRRLRQEGQLRENLVVKGERLLLPSLGHANSIVAAEILDLAWPEGLPVTILSVSARDGVTGHLAAVKAALGSRSVEMRSIASGDVLGEIVSEAKLGFGVIGVGAAERPEPGHLLSPVVDDLLGRSPIPVLVARRARGLTGPLPPAFAKALVPVSGAPESRAAQEVAFRLGGRIGTEVSLLHVVTRPDDAARGGSAKEGHTVADVAKGVVADAEMLAGTLGARTASAVRHGLTPGEEVVRAAEAEDIDIVLLGASARIVDGHVFLGHTVEHVLAHARPTVVVVVLPPTGVDFSHG